ncbi:MAG: hypothetical protein E7I22_13135 [Bifidobacterium longum]|nr:hypothetical protein [Bifidobacterium longum]
MEKTSIVAAIGGHTSSPFKASAPPICLYKVLLLHPDAVFLTNQEEIPY